VRNFRQLDVWKKAHTLTLELYRLTADFPAAEKYGLVSQIQRAAASIGANLAEGSGRDTDADFRRFVQIACGSACEVEYHLILARDLDIIDDPTYSRLTAQTNEVKRMLHGLTQYLVSNSAKNTVVPR
jgi:four helix bundle protein